MSKGRLADLTRIADALLEAELVVLKRAQDAAGATETKIAGLDAAARRQHETIAAELEAPVAGPVLDLWGGWADRRRAALNLALARERAALDLARGDAQVAFGKAEALRRIAGAAAALRRQEARRRANRAG